MDHRKIVIAISSPFNSIKCLFISCLQCISVRGTFVHPAACQRAGRARYEYTIRARGCFRGRCRLGARVDTRASFPGLRIDLDGISARALISAEVGQRRLTPAALSWFSELVAFRVGSRICRGLHRLLGARFG